MTLAGVLGFPVGHSRSPAMMNAAFAELGLSWSYLRLPVPPELFRDTVRALQGSGFGGVNVTIPHKIAAHDLADVLSPTAAAIGAANTLTFADGAIEADNTDAGGFLDALGTSPAGSSALVLGAGGAARAVAWALREEGAEVRLWNRTAARAAALAEDLGVSAVAAPGPADIVVNATSVGLDSATTEAEALAALSLEGVEPPRVFCDLVYGGGPSALCRWAERGGGQTVDGLEVLVRQGARSLLLWTGREAPIAVMREAASHG